MPVALHVLHSLFRVQSIFVNLRPDGTTTSTYHPIHAVVSLDDVIVASAASTLHALGALGAPALLLLLLSVQCVF